MKIAVQYTIFAAIATLMNIMAQDISTRIYTQDYSLIVSVLVGTATGLIIKYLLDKKFIFKYQARNFLHDTHMFSLYVLMGTVTTLIFWGFEFTFEFIFQNKMMRYTGAIIGLAIGYLIKYRLDKRFVFVKADPA